MHTSHAHAFKNRHPNRTAYEKSILQAVDYPNTVIPRSTTGISSSRSFLHDAISGATDNTLKPFSSREFSEAFAHSLETKIVPACLGRIENLLLTVPWHRGTDGQVTLMEREVRHFRSLILALGKKLIYTIVCHPDTRSEVENWKTMACNLQFIIVEVSNFNYTIWAQDAYVGLRGRLGQKILVEGVFFNREDDTMVADEIAAQTDVSAIQSCLYFQGGNILGGDKITLVGMDYMIRNLGHCGLESVEAIANRYSDLFATDILFLGGRNSGDYDWYRAGKLTGYGTQPIFHIDMYVTRTGVVGASGKEIVFLGRPKIALEIVGKRPEQGNVDIERYDAFFDQTEEQLAAHFEVHSLPLFMVHGNVNGEGYRAVKEYYNLSFNNVVIENYDNTRHVVLPTYASESEAERFGVDAYVRRELEDAAESVWRDAGFSISRTDSHEILSHAMSSSHCITKALQRDRETTSPD